MAPPIPNPKGQPFLRNLTFPTPYLEDFSGETLKAVKEAISQILGKNNSIKPPKACQVSGQIKALFEKALKWNNPTS